jgi:UDP-N-acetylmuramoyl-tripeptide--D-alanyl-D-alanine ligase
VSLDSRSVGAGEIFIALIGENNDAHRFVGDAFAKGAAAALVSRPVEGVDPARLVLVDDTMRGLEAMGRFARSRSLAKVAAVTGSVGKTSTKEALTRLLALQAPTYGNKGNLNNIFGVPLSLARLPMDAKYAVFELGMNMPGEIGPLSRQVRPDVVIITAIAPAHVGNFADGVAGIAREKAAITEGLNPGGTAILCRDTPHYGILASAAEQAGARIISFGEDAASDVRLVSYEALPSGGRLAADFAGERLNWTVGASGRHQGLNSLAVLAAVGAMGADVARAAADYAAIAAPAGRGERLVLPWGAGSITLFDDSYNASPVAVNAALAVLGAQEGRRIVVLGDMLELGDEAAELHLSLLPALEAAGPDRFFACGPHMKTVYDAAPAALRAGWAATAAELLPQILADVRAGDVVTVKGSLGMRMGPLVAALKEASARQGSDA